MEFLSESRSLMMSTVAIQEPIEFEFKNKSLFLVEGFQEFFHEASIRLFRCTQWFEPLNM